MRVRSQPIICAPFSPVSKARSPSKFTPMVGFSQSRPHTTPFTPQSIDQAERTQLVELFKEILTDRKGRIEFDSDGEMIDVDFEEQHHHRQLSKPFIKGRSMKNLYKASRPQTSFAGGMSRKALSDIGTEAQKYLRRFKLPVFDKTFRVMSVKNRKTPPKLPRKKPIQDMMLRINVTPSASHDSKEILNKILETPKIEKKPTEKLKKIEKFVKEPDKNVKLLSEFKKHIPNYHKRDDKDTPEVYLVKRRENQDKHVSANLTPHSKKMKELVMKYDNVMKSCAHILHVDKFIEKSVENARSSIVEEIEKVAAKIPKPKLERRLLGRYKREQIAYFAKYNHM